MKFNVQKGDSMKKYLFLILLVCISTIFSGCSETVDTLSVSSQNSTIQSVNSSSNVVSTQPIVSTTSTTKKPKTFSITLSFAGDFIIANSETTAYKNSFEEYAAQNTPDYFLQKVQSVFAKDDFTIVNLENVLTDNDLEKREKNHDPAYWFKAKTDHTKVLTKGSVECVSLANNHTYDYGKQGYKDTTEAVKKAGLNYGNFNEIMYCEKNGFKIAVICYGLWRPDGVKTIQNLIKRATQNSDYQIVFFHGGTEGIYTPEEWKVEACHTLVDSGADLIIGNHPHVLQPREIYKNTEIIYSLGNFLFGGNKKPGKNTIIYQMKLTVNAKTLELKDEKSTIIPCYVYQGKLNNYQPQIIKDDLEKQRVLDFMNGKAKSPYLS